MSPENTKLASEVALVFRTVVQQQLLNKLSDMHRTVGHFILPPWASVVSAPQLADLLECSSTDDLLIQYSQAFQVLRRFEYLQYGKIDSCSARSLSLSTSKPIFYAKHVAEAVPVKDWFFYINDRGREFIRQMDTDEKVLQYLGMFRTNTSAAHA